MIDFQATLIAKSSVEKMVAEREGIEPTKDRLPFNGFENRGDHQARSTLRRKNGGDSGGRQMNGEEVTSFSGESRPQRGKGLAEVLGGGGGGEGFQGLRRES